MTTIIRKLDEQAPGSDLGGTRAQHSDLAQAVCEAVANVDWTKPNYLGWTGRHRTFRTEVMLAILSYCYLSRIFNSREIEERLARSQILHGLLEEEVFTARDFMRFRKVNRRANAGPEPSD